MAIRDKINTVFRILNNIPDYNRSESDQEAIDLVCILADAEILTDNYAQYVIYTGIYEPHKYKPSSLTASCIVCDQNPDNPYHTE